MYLRTLEAIISDTNYRAEFDKTFFFVDRQFSGCKIKYEQILHNPRKK